MKTKLFNYNLHKELIAQEPVSPRDACRFLVLDKETKKIKDDKFKNIGNYLNPGDVLVLNNTKVIPARLIGHLIHEDDSIGRKYEIFLLKDLGEGKWQCLLGGKKRGKGLKVLVKKNFIGKIKKHNPDNTWVIEFNKKGQVLHRLILQLGETPIPPYIKKSGKNKKIQSDYQTIFAKYEGSVAAPTAGLHFTKRLLAQLEKQGVEIEYVTLHVGLGTFMPVKVEDIRDHKMHKEYFEIKQEVAKKLNKAKQDGRRIIAVGTTSLRALEASAQEITNSKHYILNPKSSNTNIFIYPGYKFKFVDSLITNFHLPCSTLLMLVSAMAGRKTILDAYKYAIRKKYRFYSFGDAMLIE